MFPRVTVRVFDDDNCITAASTRSIISGLPPIVKKSSTATPGGSSSSSIPKAAGTGPGDVIDDGVGGGAGGETGGAGGGGSSGDNNSNSSSDGPHKMQMATYIFALLLAAGSLVGYIKKGSVKSLGAGFSSTLLLGLCARAMTSPAATGPARVAFALCLMLGGVMASRFSETKKVMPAGLVGGSSLLMAAGFVIVGL